MVGGDKILSGISRNTAGLGLYSVLATTSRVLEILKLHAYIQKLFQCCLAKQKRRAAHSKVRDDEGSTSYAPSVHTIKEKEGEAYEVEVVSEGHEDHHERSGYQGESVGWRSHLA